MATLGPPRAAAAAMCLAALAAAAPANATIMTPVGVPGRTGAAETCGLQDGDERYCPRPKSDGNIGIGLLILPVLIIGWLAGKIFSGDGIDSADSLDENGPKTSNQERLGQFTAQGVVHPGWPVVVEARWQPGATTFLQIALNNSKKSAFLILSDEGGTIQAKNRILPQEQYRTEGGILSMFVLPADFRKSDGDGFHGARFTVLSGRVTGEGKDTELDPMPLEVLALGAGPNAVGSAAVVIRSFSAPSPARRAAYTVMYNEQRRFGRLRAELIRRDAKGRDISREPIEKKDLCLDPSGRDICRLGPPGKPYVIPGEWPQQSGQQLKPGSSYHMNLRAWSKRVADGGWVIAQAPQVLAWR